MPKMKTRSCVKKRFRLTASGRVKHKHAFQRHILTKKSKKRKRHLRMAAIVDATQEAKVRHMLVA